MDAVAKPVHTVVLDAGPLIANNPSISTLMMNSEKILTTPSVMKEIRDPVARSRVETTFTPFLDVRIPQAQSVKFVRDFAQKTGDLAVLSQTDLEVIALAYELECERNHGDWRLRKTPGQKGVNGPPPKLDEIKEPENAAATVSSGKQNEPSMVSTSGQQDLPQESTIEHIDQRGLKDAGDSSENEAVPEHTDQQAVVEAAESAYSQSQAHPTIEICSHKDVDKLSNTISALSIGTSAMPKANEATTTTTEVKPSPVDATPAQSPADPPSPSLDPESDSDSDSDSDSEGWITPSNLKRYQAASASSNSTASTPAPKTLQVATITTDFALQNVLLQINLNLLSPSLSRISHVKSTILRCHACFSTTRETTRQFCPRCGKDALTRVTTTTSASGKTQLHLKKNMAWSHRGDRYSIPKPVAGTANGKMREKGGGKAGWGRGLILAEDQKEYVRAVEGREREQRRGQRDLFDRDYLPGILSGERTGGMGGRIKVGAGRNVNSRKRGK